MKPTIIDVRTPEEFADGHIQGSFNIPLHELPERHAELKQLPRPIYLCCASGNRSGQALAYLQSIGITGLDNGGGWRQLQQQLEVQL